MSCIYSTTPQGSKEWLLERCGAITGSMFKTCTETLKSGKNKGSYSKAADDYAFKLAVERVSGEILDEPEFDSWQARRGRELEPVARMEYEARQACLVEEVGLALSEDRKFGASIDGLLDETGGLEIKCFLAPSKVKEIILSGDIGDCKHQVQGGMWITGLEYFDFVLYCPALRSIGKDMTIIRVERDDDFISDMEEKLMAFDSHVEGYVAKLKA